MALLNSALLLEGSGGNGGRMTLERLALHAALCDTLLFETGT
jgi:hypothetical protein